jgi:hypothetical protein
LFPDGRLFFSVSRFCSAGNFWKKLKTNIVLFSRAKTKNKNMVTSVHILTGLAITKNISNPAISLPLALISHYIPDRIPHCRQKPVKNYLERGLKGCDKKDLLIKGFEPALGIIFAFYYISTRQNMATTLMAGAFVA